MQTTIAKKVSFTDVGLHTGEPATATICPAPAGHGIVFKRTDIHDTDNEIAALWHNVCISPLNTRIENASGITVSTIEHLMAALSGCGVHNALILLDGPEVPVLDGSSAAFVHGLVRAGLTRLHNEMHAIEILSPIEARNGDSFARLDPATTLQMDFSIDFVDAAIGRQNKTLNLANGAFVRELCDSRTFCRNVDVKAMQAGGFALGGTMDNAVVVEGDKVLSNGGLRHIDEAVRHKMLDALGDLATAGAPILGRYTGVRAGHALTNQLLRTLYANPDCWRLVRCDAAIAARLPGVGVSVADLANVA